MLAWVCRVGVHFPHIGFSHTAPPLPFSSIRLICPFLSVFKKLCLTTKQRALGFEKHGWSCGFQSLHLTNRVLAPAFFFGGFPHPNGCRFCRLCVEH